MSPTQSFWKQFPRRSTVIFLLGVFLIFSTMAFVNDMMGLGRQPTAALVLSVLILGVFPVLYAFAGFALRTKSWKAIVPIFIVHYSLMSMIAHLLPLPPRPEQMGPTEITRLDNRLSFDGLATIFAVWLGYGCFVYVSITESRRYLRVRAEIELAAEIHRVLVPAIETKIGGYEFYGRSFPSGESGHGVAPGVVTGMVKSAARMLLSSSDDTAHLLQRLNEVLYPLKKPDMFVTFCFVARNDAGLRIGLAGHPAILHFCARSDHIAQFECPNMPLGISRPEISKAPRFRPSQETSSRSTPTDSSNRRTPRVKNSASRGSKRNSRNTPRNPWRQFAARYKKAWLVTALNSTTSRSC
jgi:Stage II sporulation protein E (SpoIIE)